MASDINKNDGFQAVIIFLLHFSTQHYALEEKEME